MRVLLLCLLLLICSQTQRETHVDLEALRNERCMANALFHEARGESILGQRAVYDVVVNRSKASGKSVCEVIAERNAFSWMTPGKHYKPMQPMSMELYNLLQSVEKSDRVLSGDYLWFFGKQIRPVWSRKMKCSTVDSHRFCRK